MMIFTDFRLAHPAVFSLFRVSLNDDGRDILVLESKGATIISGFSLDVPFIRSPLELIPGRGWDPVLHLR